MQLAEENKRIVCCCCFTVGFVFAFKDLILSKSIKERGVIGKSASLFLKKIIINVPGYALFPWDTFWCSSVAQRKPVG